MATALTFAGCGGGSLTPPPLSDTPPPPPSSTVGTVSGPISGFGSVIVNGTRYDTSGATFNIDGDSGTENNLKVGQIVTMKVSTDDNGNKSASEVEFEDVVQGPITSVDLANDSFVVMGQTVLTRNSTSFDDDITRASLDGLMVGDIVEVSGYINSAVDIIASQIELKDATEDYELTGEVSNLNAGGMTFEINSQVIDYSNAALEDFPSGADIANGDIVEVEGSAFNGNMFIADTVEYEDPDLDVEEGEDGEVFGPITEFGSSADFMVGAIRVNASDAEFEECRAADLRLDLELEVEGEFDANGVLVAEEVECEEEPDLEVEGLVDSIDATAETLTVLGVTFAADQSTRFDDMSDVDDAMFNFDAIQIGDYVEITGVERDDMTLYATKIERDDEMDSAAVTGPVDTVGLDSLIILGVTVETDSQTQYDESMSASDFFNQVMVGDTVEAEGTETVGGNLLASEIEFED